MSPGSWRDQHERLKRSKRNATCDAVRRLLLAAGWTLQRQSGSHETYVKDGCPSIITITCKKGHVRIGQVAELLRIIDECSEDDEGGR